MFRGSSFHTMDPKGRIIIPSRFKDIIKAGGGEGLMLSKLDGGLVGYTYDEWGKVENRILSMAKKSESMRRFRRVFIGGANDCSLDKQGRFLVPQPLRQYAELEKEVVLVGVLDHFELWSRERWDAENMKSDEEMKDVEVRNEIADLGL